MMCCTYLLLICCIQSRYYCTVSFVYPRFGKITNSNQFSDPARSISYFENNLLVDKQKKIIVIGAGFSGLAAAALMAKQGCYVTLLEKSGQPGGRAAIWEKDGFRFDMGPSWYWMPDVFEDYFALFGKKPSDFYDLKRLDPGYRIYFGKNDAMDIPAGMAQLEVLFESIEPGSSTKLRKFLEQAAIKYNKIGRAHV